MSFASPLFLLALLVVPAALVFALAIDRRRARYPVAFTNLDLIAKVIEGRRRQWRRWLPLIILLLALATAATALARPRAHVTVADQKATVVILVDVSGSMRATDVSPTRLDAAVAAMRTFLDRLPKQFKVGLVAFSNTPEVLQLPTHDRQLARQALGYLAPEAGTAIGDGLAAAVRLVKTSLARDGISRQPGKELPAAIVFLSDGAQNRGQLQPLQAAALAHAAGIRVDTVALGTPTGRVTVGVGPFVNSFPVPPDPGSRTRDRAGDRRTQLHRPKRRPAQQHLQHARLEHRQADRAAGDHLLVRGRHSCSPARVGRPRARLGRPGSVVL